MERVFKKALCIGLSKQSARVRVIIAKQQLSVAIDVPVIVA